MYSQADFVKNCVVFARRSDILRDGWTMVEFDKRNSFLSKKEMKLLDHQEINMQYHVMYDESYQVPVLYFSATSSTGRLIKPGDLRAMLDIPQEQADGISQKDHPLLDTPFYYIHPCHTSKMMQDLGAGSQNSDGNSLLTFLSSVGPVAGLYIPHTYLTTHD